MAVVYILKVPEAAHFSPDAPCFCVYCFQCVNGRECVAAAQVEAVKKEGL